jgi:uncharacterized protein involved in response to NO
MNPPSTAPRWRFHHLLEAPHRLAFSAATLLLAVSGLWWALVLLLAGEGVSVRWSLPPAIAHGALMGLGFMPLFITGFLFTAGPKWLQAPPVKAASLLDPLLAMLAGWAVFGLSLHGRDAAFGHTLGAFGLGAVATGWFGIVRRFLALRRAGRSADRLHATLIAAACVFGLFAMVVAAVGLATGSDTLVRAATSSSMWAFVGLVFVTVAHRMLPYFAGTASLQAWHPAWMLGGFVLLFVMEALAAMAQALGLPWLRPLAAALAATETLAGGVLLAIAVDWWRSPAVHRRLPAMLHLGFSWLGIAVLLGGVSRALSLASPPLSLGLAPLHAFTMGFLGSTMFAMVTRVTAGQSGQAVVADDLVWRLFWVLQLAVLLRCAAAVLVVFSSVATLPLLVSAAIGWAGVCITWALRHGRRFGLPGGPPVDRAG